MQTSIIKPIIIAFKIVPIPGFCFKGNHNSKTALRRLPRAQRHGAAGVRCRRGAVAMVSAGVGERQNSVYSHRRRDATDDGAPRLASPIRAA